MPVHRLAHPLRARPGERPARLLDEWRAGRLGHQCGPADGDGADAPEPELLQQVGRGRAATLLQRVQLGTRGEHAVRLAAKGRGLLLLRRVGAQEQVRQHRPLVGAGRGRLLPRLLRRLPRVQDARLLPDGRVVRRHLYARPEHTPACRAVRAPHPRARCQTCPLS